MSIVYGVLLLLFALLLTFAYAGLRGAPWVPAHSRDIGRYLALAKIRAGERVFDLGCGDARMLAAAAREGAIAIGYEISLLPYCLAILRSLRLPPRQRPRILFRDFWQADLRSADLVFVFLMPATLKKLQPKLHRELRAGTRVMSYVWPFPDWQADKIDSGDPRSPKIYHYTM